MKQIVWGLVWGMVCGLPAAAQIEIDLIEAEVVEETPMEAPEVRDHSQPPTPQEPTIHFLNHNQLTGNLISLGEEGLVWQHPDAAAPITFVTGNLKRVDLRPNREAAQAWADLPRIVLTNGDVIRGKILGLKDGALDVDCPAIGRMRVQARMVKALEPNAVSTTLYQGPTSIEEWELHNLSGMEQQWEYRDGALYAKDRNQIALIKPEDLPDRYTLSMDVEWKGVLNFQLGFWGNNTQNPNNNTYALSIQNNYLRAYRNYNNLGRNNFGNQQLQEALSDGRTRLTLHLNKAEKQMLFLLDGTLHGQWRDLFEGDIRGDTFMLCTQGNSSLRVSNIRIREWDGEMNLKPEEADAEQDRLITTNGDEFTGNLEGIAGGVLSFRNEFAEFQVPLDRVGELHFAASSRATPRLQNGDVVVSTATGEQITLQVASIKGGVLAGQSEATGEVDLRLQYFAEVMFNPYDDRHAEEANAW